MSFSLSCLFNPIGCVESGVESAFQAALPFIIAIAGGSLAIAGVYYYSEYRGVKSGNNIIKTNLN